MIEQILTEINDTVQLRMGGKLTKFRGHKGITENHESFYPRKFLAVRYFFLVLPPPKNINERSVIKVLVYCLRNFY